MQAFAQIRKSSFAALACAAALIAPGCGGASAWTWSDPPAYHTNDAAPMHPHRFASEDRVDPGVAVFAQSGFVRDDRPEATRRDDTIAARSPEALPDRLGWPREARPDLRRTRTVRTGRTAETWVYPDARRDTIRSRHGVYRHGGPVYPPYRGW
ncbi:MAG: hypothetical protein LAT64_12590 [Phycisphaerales bacterium]|nr:hypothetical protein [Planctomycetota bacterium]MCH8509592.1 hypothetical protein [Phycisphaerales bacterium]